HDPIDHFRVKPGDLIVAEAKPLHNPGPKILDEHIGTGDELLHLGQVFRIFQVSREALFVAVDGVKQRAVAVQFKVCDIKLSADVAGAGALNLDDPGAEVGQAHRRARPGQELAKIEHEQSFEWFHDFFLTSKRCSQANTVSLRWFNTSTSSLTMPWPGFLCSR